MGGKSYFCDYCQCYMKNDINVRKVHHSGLSHTIARITYMRKYTDPQQLLEEESKKTPCSRFHSNRYCKFELLCQYTHYTPKQLEHIRKIVNKLEENKRHRKPKKTNSLESDWRKALPWNIGDRSKKKRKIKLPKNLPPSLKPLQFSKLTEDVLSAEWG